jgi:hypothetical protein
MGHLHTVGGIFQLALAMAWRRAQHIEGFEDSNLSSMVLWFFPIHHTPVFTKINTSFQE